jgi:hypothetical protein
VGWGVWISHGGTFDFFVGRKLFLCRSFERRREKNKVGPKISQCVLELIYHMRLAIAKLAYNMARYISDKMLVCN